MSADDLRFHLRLVLQTTQRERVSQRYLDAIEKKLAETPDGDPRKPGLRMQRHKAIKAVRHHRRLAVYATALAEKDLYPEGMKLVKQSEQENAA